MGMHHLAAALRRSFLVPVGLLERDPSRHRDLASRTGLPVDSDLARLASIATADCAIIATPDPTHVAIADTCLLLGLHTLVEKPLSTSPSEASALLERFDRAGLVLGSGLVERFNPAWNTLRAKVSGDPLVSRIRIVRQGPPPRSPSSGPIFDLAVHDIDLLLHWAGNAGTLQTLAAKVSPTHLHALFSIAGIAVELTATWRPGPSVRTWTVETDRDTWNADLQGRTLIRTDGDGTRNEFIVPEMDALEQEHAAFANAIRGESNDTFPGIQRHVRALELCQILSESRTD